MKRTFIILSSLFLFYDIYAGPTVVGSIDGVFDVNNLGAASYTIPLKVPAGIHGMEPILSLNYNSNGGNGIMGMGWSLGGTSAITVTGSDIYHDKHSAGKLLDGTDHFMLDGQRLIVVSGGYGAAGSQYRTETESFKTITANGQQNGSPQSFTVIDQNGTKYEYGISTNSRATLAFSTNERPYMWLLEKVTDLNGNYMTYEYSHYNYFYFGQVTLSKIKYTYNSFSGLPYSSYVLFTYSPKSDSNFTCLDRRYISNRSRLDKIVMMHQVGTTWKIYRTYDLTYALDFYTHLVAVKETGTNGNSLPPTTFEYGTASNTVDINYSTGCTAPHGYIRSITGDYNGDGLTDFITLPLLYNTSYTYNTWDLYLNNGDGSYSNTQSVSLGATPSAIEERYNYPVRRNYATAFFDYNGDGKEDFFYRKEVPVSSTSSDDINIYNLFISDGSSLNSLPNIFSDCGADFLNTYPLMGDFDGDGKTEILVLASNNGNCGSGAKGWMIGEEYLTQGSGNTLRAAPLSNMPFSGMYVNANYPGDNKFYVLDNDGDGKSEVLSHFFNPHWWDFIYKIPRRW